ncbi:MAG: phosphatidylglycerophosphatase A [Gammaproteobacteria bacterium]|nr:phosphatidylglycerophosphatase A [Gammaproteobacteria bacterium]MDH5693610.1 phosphatidylglycerophosphatase A [Gammaproteobacteria bacterium]
MAQSEHIAKWIALGGGSGLAPVAPGTFGTLAAIPLYLLCAQFHWSFYLAVIAVTVLLGIWSSDVYSRVLGVHDHGSIVIDEVAGYLITMMLVPFSWLNLVLGFVLFRVFDIWKPWPIRQLDRNVHGGLGIMLDDLLAGLMAALILFFLVNYVPIS